MANFPEMLTWLKVDVQKSTDGKYEHALVLEVESARDTVLPLLKFRVTEAHDDARRRLRDLVGPSLDPLCEEGVWDPANGYPEQLHIKTLKGYFGEVMAGLVAENLDPFGHDDWEVPAHLFRFHLVEFQQLDLMRQTGKEAKVRPGRTGDDCLAFRMNDNGEIIAALFCEAKCRTGHKAAAIGDAHEKSSLSNLIPIDLLRVIEVLMENNDAESKRWVSALRMLYFKGSQPGARYERVDQITYVCGRHPKRKKTWICTDQPHADYTAGRRLHVAELHLSDIDEIIEAVYGIV